MEIIPTILTDNPEDVQKTMRLLESKTTWLHLDVIDGVFAPMKTVEPAILVDYQEKFFYEAHLMVDAPQDWVSQCELSGVTRVVGQIERMDDQMAFVDDVLVRDMEVGLAIDLETPVGAIAEDAWLWLDVLLVMGVKAGAIGQQLDLAILEKIKMITARRKRHGLPLKIEVDGGLRRDNIVQISESGVDIVAGNTVIYEHGAIEQNLRDLHALIA